MESLFKVPVRIGLVLTATVATLVVSAVSAIAAPVDTGVGSTYECTGDVAGAQQDPVVLLHGTWTTSAEDFGAVLEPWLTQTGRPFCTVELPRRATVDMQISAQYVVDAIVRTAQTRDGKVDVIGHSQGGTLGAYAIEMYPEVAAVVDDYVGLAPVAKGQTLTDQLCSATGGCAAPVWQFAEGSEFMTAFESAPLPAGPSFTTVATAFDELVRPAPFGNAIDGAANLVVQDLCPGKYVSHVLLPADATAIAMTADALDNVGPADFSRLGTDSCLQLTPPGINPLAPLGTAPTALAGLVEAQVLTERLPAEPLYTGP
ncbi:MAG: alpha/beta fold hydrolase [Rhodococcus sp. (in: high G+C Gram-positive bacteria)]